MSRRCIAIANESNMNLMSSNEQLFCHYWGNHCDANKLSFLLLKKNSDQDLYHGLNVPKAWGKREEWNP